MAHVQAVRKVLRDDFFTKAHWKDTMHSTFRMFPLLASIIAPLSVLLDIPALSQPWYGYETQELTDEKTSLILSAISLFFNLVANLLLLLRFSINSRKGYTISTRVSMVFWILKSTVAMVNLIIFGAYHNNSPGYTYLEGFYCAIVSCILASISSLALIIHYFYEFDPKVLLKNNEVRLRGRTFMLNVTLLVVSLGIQGLVFSRIESWTYLDGIYFSTVSVLTVGFGDFSPTTTAGKILLFPFVLIGIAQLALVVSQIIDFFSERSLNITRVTRHHIERERLRKEMSMDIIDLNAELKLLEKSQKEEDDREEMINLGYSLVSFFTLWFLGALIFSQIEGWTYGNGLYFNYIFFLTLGYGDFTPTLPASRVVFIPYALMAVPIMTSFAVQSITKAMSLLAEQRIIRRREAIKGRPQATSHHALLDEAADNLAKVEHREQLQRMLVDSVLQMDLATRKLLSISLTGHTKLLLKADTLVQMRNTSYDHHDFIEQFQDVKPFQELENYRKRFANFLTIGSDLLELEGEEARLFKRRIKEERAAIDDEKEEAAGRKNSQEQPQSDTTDATLAPTTSNTEQHAQNKNDRLEFHMNQHRHESIGNDETDDVSQKSTRPDSQRTSSSSSSSSSSSGSPGLENADKDEEKSQGHHHAHHHHHGASHEAWVRPFSRRKKSAKNQVLQSKGLSDSKRDREQASEEEGGPDADDLDGTL